MKNKIKQFTSAFLVVLALGLSIAAQSQTVGSGGATGGQTVGSGGATSGGLIGSGTFVDGSGLIGSGTLNDAADYLQSLFDGIL